MCQIGVTCLSADLFQWASSIKIQLCLSSTKQTLLSNISGSSMIELKNYSLALNSSHLVKSEICDICHSELLMPLNYEQSNVFIDSWALNQVLWLRLTSNLYLALDKGEGHWLLGQIIDYCLTSRMRTSSIIYKSYIEMREEMGQWLLTATEKVWTGSKNLVFSSGYDVPMHFQNLQEINWYTMIC